MPRIDVDAFENALIEALRAAQAAARRNAAQHITINGKLIKIHARRPRPGVWLIGIKHKGGE